MSTQLYCPDETRKALVRAAGTLNGIDFLEVLDHEAPAFAPQQTLLVHCFLSVAGLDKENVRIDGGVRVGPITPAWAYAITTLLAEQPDLLTPSERDYLDDASRFPEPERVLVVRTESPSGGATRGQGDFSTYTLRLIFSPREPDLPPGGFDALLAAVDFSFKVDCPSDFDCGTAPICPEPVLPVPQIDYLARDYASFRRLMLDRLAVTMPQWQERNPADLGIALVELLSYAGDHLSYYQDAVAAEAYLGTARRRVSVRRHARLVDYFLHDGANARVWVCLEVEPGAPATLPKATRLLSRDLGGSSNPAQEQPAAAPSGTPIVFETLHDARLTSARNCIPFYTGDDPCCCLPSGATGATLLKSADLELHEGDVLIFEEVLGAASGRPEDADPAHRHVVRLDSPPVERTDPLRGTQVLDISWYQEDALPFPLCLWQFTDPADGVQGACVARGNVVLADHGATIKNEPLIPEQVPANEPAPARPSCWRGTPAELHPALAAESPPYRPFLQRSGVTQQMPYDDAVARAQPAASALQQDLRRVMPAVTLRGEGETWVPRRDLLSSDRFATEFVVEVESDGRAQLRFGDDLLGRQPAAGTRLTATYRVGHGQVGNVGAEALTRVAAEIPGIRRVRNPLPASGGTDPEALEWVRLSAPQAFRIQERAITEADYAAMAQRHPDVQRAAATRRWTGSWYTMFVSVDRRGGRPVDATFKTQLRALLERFRLAGHDLEIEAPLFVPLDVALGVCVAPGHRRSDVKQALFEAFSTAELPGGQRGFFHPDNFTFSQPVYLSRIVARAMQVQGVAWVDTDASPTTRNRFQRWGKPPSGELQAGQISFGRLEIARLDNDPSARENGRLEFFLQGGL